MNRSVGARLGPREGAQTPNPWQPQEQEDLEPTQTHDPVDRNAHYRFQPINPNQDDNEEIERCKLCVQRYVKREDLDQHMRSYHRITQNEGVRSQTENYYRGFHNPNEEQTVRLGGIGLAGRWL